MSYVAPTAAEPSPAPNAPRVWPALRYFFTRRRVAISSFLFLSLAAINIVAGVRPRDLFNFHDPVIWIGLALVFWGLAIRSWAVGILRKNYMLTTTGPYGLTRNPLYAGSFLMMFGFCALIGDAKFVWLMLIPIARLYYLRIHVEEQQLAERFGSAWSDYRATTPRLFPRRLWPREGAQWLLAKWLRSREYRAVLTALAGLAAIQVWRALSTRG